MSNDANYNEGLRNNIIKDIENLEQKIDIIWGSIITNEISNAMKLISEFFGDLDRIIEELSSISENNIDIVEFFKYMSELENAMKIPDYMLIADLIKYEIKPIVDTWKSRFN